MISAQSVLASVSPTGVRLDTMVLKMPKYLLAQFNTHRVFSRNASSSRAIPTSKVLEDVTKFPSLPTTWGINQKGMQASETLSPPEEEEAVKIWLAHRDSTVEVVKKLQKLGLHKQTLNRLLEPFMWADVVASSTEWENFFSLRIHPDAQPEMAQLAEKMRRAYDEALPRRTAYGEWHTPMGELGNRVYLQTSVARCARVSYRNHRGLLSSLDEDSSLHDKLLNHSPPHASPAEHQATPLPRKGLFRKREQKSGNFTGWLQYRHFYARVLAVGPEK